jgi:hypothetical protein
MTGTNCDLFTHNQSRSYLNHLVLYFLDRFSNKHSSTKFHTNISVRSRVVAREKTEGHTDSQTDITMLTFAFPNFANAPKNTAISVNRKFVYPPRFTFLTSIMFSAVPHKRPHYACSRSLNVDDVASPSQSDSISSLARSTGSVLHRLNKTCCGLNTSSHWRGSTHTHSHSLSLTHSHTHTHYLSLSHTHTHSLTHTLSLSHTYTHSHTHTHSLSHTYTHTHSLTHTHSHTLSLSLTHTHTLSLSHTHTHTLTHTLSLSLTHTHSHTLSLSHTHTHTQDKQQHGEPARAFTMTE